jgi:hypothetical protein
MSKQPKYKVGDILRHRATQGVENAMRFVVIQVGVFKDADENETVVYQISGLNQDENAFLRGIIDESELIYY